MKRFAPAYYPAFRCIAGDCRHSCCIGWEICIDPATLARYRALPPKQRKAILSRTVTGSDGTSFRLADGGRCSFLTENGLCQLILTHGEGILCEICREHPRFYNTFSDRIEVGLGLCCEEAARLILTSSEPFCLIALEADPDENRLPDPFEALFFAQREESFSILSRRTLPLTERIDDLLARYSLSRAAILENDRRWQTVYRNLERLDPAWDSALTAWEQSAEPLSMPADWEVPTEQLIAYFLYRHSADAIDREDYPVRVAFAILSAYVICRIAAAIRPGDLATLIDTARAYSAEVEYDEENVEAILRELEQ